MAAGTAAALVPIKSITMRSRGDEFKYQDGGDEPGPACVRLLTTLKGIQQGKLPDQFGWLSSVKKAERGEYEAGQNGEGNGERMQGVGKGMVDKLP